MPIKDGSASFIVLVAITTITESSLILIDAFNNTEMINEISGIVARHPRVVLKDTRLMIVGFCILRELIIAVDKNMTVGNLFVIKGEIISDVKREIEDVKDIVISSEPMP